MHDVPHFTGNFMPALTSRPVVGVTAIIILAALPEPTASPGLPVVINEGLSLSLITATTAIRLAFAGNWKAQWKGLCIICSTTWCKATSA
jgi:hypothetical protein